MITYLVAFVLGISGSALIDMNNESREQTARSMLGLWLVLYGAWIAIGP
jgi:hypothetical protein